MPTTEKVIMVDRVPESLTSDEMKAVMEDYAKYCMVMYKFSDDIKIPDREAKRAVFGAILSPLQYFIEDRVRIKRLNEGRLIQEAKQQYRR
jgi:hypothetical protein